MPTERPAILERLRRLRFSIASTGLWRALADTATLLLAYHPDRDRSFDQQYGTDTAGTVPPEQLGIADAAVRKHAILYLPSPPRVTRWMLDNIGIAHSGFSFVDLGCGKGRVVLVASEYPFQRVIGVEISPELTEIARENIARYKPAARCLNVEVRNADATTVDFPETNLIVHLYHPFELPVTRAVLSRLQASVDAKPRKVAVAYLLYTSAVEPVEALFASFPWLQRQRYEQSVLGQYNWLFYSN